jgi:hypothetical protein
MVSFRKHGNLKYRLSGNGESVPLIRFFSDGSVFSLSLFSRRTFMVKTSHQSGIFCDIMSHFAIGNIAAVIGKQSAITM